MDENTSLLALFTSSFLAATLLPGGSEAVLVGVLIAYPDLFWPALNVATIGNTLGGLSSYIIGRLLPNEQALSKRLGRHVHGLKWTRHHGAPILFLSWLPLIGDVLCLAAGWLRINWISAALFIALGKFVRYWVIAVAIN
jgi:membrane protein YqaA with SNARE-associated domain